MEISSKLPLLSETYLWVAASEFVSYECSITFLAFYFMEQAMSRKFKVLEANYKNHNAFEQHF
jgi:hypothetical protein